jgi:sugar phosphate isomerase/epimerase
VPVDCLKMLEGHIIEFHFKDIDTKKEDVPWGTGECNVPAMLEEIKRQKIHGVMSIEYETGEGDALLVNVRKCIEYFNAQADRLAKE